MKYKLTGLMLLMAAVLWFLPNEGFAKSFTKEDIKNSLPKLLGANNAGKDFYFTFHPCWETGGQGNDLMIYVSSGVKTKVTLEIPGKGKIYKQNTVPNDIIAFKLSPGEGQCYRKTDRDPPEKDAVYPGNAVHVYSDDPIICYGVTRYVYTSDGFLAVPVPGCGKEYLVASWADPANETIQWLTSYTSVVGIYDKTKVRFTMGGTSWSTTVSGQKPGETKNYNLNQADVLLIGALGSHSEVTGSHVIASKPVGLLSGNFCAYIPTNCGCCDFISEMELPMNTWGTEYHVTQIWERTKNSMIRIFSKEPKTSIFRDGGQIGYIRDVGGTEGDGWLGMRGDDGAPRPIVISGDKPINVTQYNCGQSDDNVPSDPFQMVLTPLEQYQTEIVFNTPGIKGGLGFPKNYVNLCYQATESGTIPDDIEFAEVVGGQFDWKQLKAISANPGIEFRVRVKGKRFFSKTITLPHDGVYKIRGKSQFAAYAYGFSSYDSYGFPTSVALGDLTVRDTIPPDPKWTFFCDGTVNRSGDIEVVDMPEDPANRSNLGLIYLHTDLSYNYRLTYADFVPGDDRSTTWQMTVINKFKDAHAVVTFTDRAGNDTTITIDYYATKLTIRPEVADFGRLAKGQQKDIKFWAINESKTSRAYMSRLTMRTAETGSPSQGFTLLDVNGNAFTLPQFIPQQDSLPFIVRFNATVEGTFKDSIGLGDTCVFEYISFVNAEVGMPVIQCTDWHFGSVTVGKLSSGEITVKNTGTTQLDIYSTAGPFDTKTFNSQDLIDMSITPTTPKSLAPFANNTFTYSVIFSPLATKFYADSIIYSSNTAMDPTADSISNIDGTGIQAGLIANNYDWDRRRIDRPGKFDVPAYDAVQTATQDVAIKLINNGTEDVTIRKVNFKKKVNETAFECDWNQFIGLTVKLQDSVIIPVKFHPTVTGEHELVIGYDNTANSTTETRLHGIGIVPQVFTADVAFATTVVNDDQHPDLKRFRFTNKALADWQYGDALTITDFADVNVGNGPMNDPTMNGKPFKYDKAGVPFPLTLQPGDYVEYDAKFVAQDVPLANGSVASVSDAETEATSNWTGSGVLQGINIVGNTTTTCVQNTVPMDVVVTNTGVTDLTVDSIVFNPSIKELTWKAAPPLGFVMGPGEVRKFTVNFNGATAKTYTTTIDVYNSSVFNPKVSNTVTGTAVDYTRSATVDFADAGSLNDLIPIGLDSKRKITLAPGSDIAMAAVKELRLKLNYKGDFIRIKKENVILGSALANCVIKSLRTNDITGETNIIIGVSNPADIINLKDGGELLNFKLNTYLPTNKASGRVSTVDLAMTAFADPTSSTQTPCVTIQTTGSRIEIDSTCVFPVRMINVNATQFALAAINPNPVGSDGTNIEFSTGLDGEMSLDIFNAQGQIVATPMSGNHKAGQYSVKVPVDNLASGVYMVKLRSGKYEQTQPLVIAK